MAENNRLRVLNILGGARDGGAEKFFERISLAFAKDPNIDLEIIIRKNSNRFDRLKDTIKKFTKLSFIFLILYVIERYKEFLMNLNLILF